MEVAVNAIQYGKLKIVARLGELMPARPPEDRGQGRKRNDERKESPIAGEADFADATKAKFRKVAAHAGKLDDYNQACAEKDYAAR